MSKSLTTEAVPHFTSVWCEKKDKNLYMSYYVSHKEHLDIAQTIGDSAVLLYQHYLRMAAVTHPIITDESAAASLGWTPRKAKRYRLLLTRHKYYYQAKYKINGMPGIQYHIGQAAVSHALAQIPDKSRDLN